MGKDWTIEKADERIAALTASQQAILEQLDCVYMPQALVKIRELQAENAQLRRAVEAADKVEDEIIYDARDPKDTSYTCAPCWDCAMDLRRALADWRARA